MNKINEINKIKNKRKREREYQYVYYMNVIENIQYIKIYIIFL